MFVKLSKQSTSWWFCIIVSSALAACLLTILAYPAYAALCDGTCTEDDCGDPPNGACGVCDDDFDDWEFRADVLGIDKWNDDGTCMARAITFHKASARNSGNNQRSITYEYRGIIRNLGGCHRSSSQAVPLRTLVVPAGQTRTNTYTLYTTYTLAADTSSNCSYDAQAVTEWTFKDRMGGDLGGDVHSTCGRYRLGANCGQ